MSELFLEDNPLGFTAQELAEDGKPFSLWDGQTIYYADPELVKKSSKNGSIYTTEAQQILRGHGMPSKYEEKYVTVYGDGTFFSLKLTEQEITKLRWVAKDIQYYDLENAKIDANVQAYCPTQVKGNVVTIKCDSKQKDNYKYYFCYDNLQDYNVDFGTVDFNKDIKGGIDLKNVPQHSDTSNANIFEREFFPYKVGVRLNGLDAKKHESSFLYVQLSGAPQFIKYPRSTISEATENKELMLARMHIGYNYNINYPPNNLASGTTGFYDAYNIPSFTLPVTFKRMLNIECKSKQQPSQFASRIYYTDGKNKKSSEIKIGTDETRIGNYLTSPLKYKDIDNYEHLLACNDGPIDMLPPAFSEDNSYEGLAGYRKNVPEYTSILFKNYVLTHDSNDGYPIQNHWTYYIQSATGASYGEIISGINNRQLIAGEIYKSLEGKSTIVRDYRRFIPQSSGVAYALGCDLFDSTVFYNNINFSIHPLNTILSYSEAGSKEYWVALGNSNTSFDLILQTKGNYINFEPVGLPRLTQDKVFGTVKDSYDKQEKINYGIIDSNGVKFPGLSKEVTNGTKITVQTGQNFSSMGRSEYLLSLSGLNYDATMYTPDVSLDRLSKYYGYNSNYKYIDQGAYGSLYPQNASSLYTTMQQYKLQKKDMIISKMPVEIQFSKENIKNFNIFQIQFATPVRGYVRLDKVLGTYDYNSREFLNIEKEQGKFNSGNYDTIKVQDVLDQVKIKMQVNSLTSPTPKYKITKFLTYKDANGKNTYDPDTGEILASK